MKRAAIVVLLALATGLAGCVGSALPTPASDDVAGHGDMMMEGGHHMEGSAPQNGTDLGPPDVVLDVRAGAPTEFAFDPSDVSVPAFSVVEVRVTNAGGAPHTFTVHAHGVDTGVLDPGETRAVKFRTGAAGASEIMCDVPGHYEAGMKGTLIVG